VYGVESAKIQTYFPHFYSLKIIMSLETVSFFILILKNHEPKPRLLLEPLLIRNF